MRVTLSNGRTFVGSFMAYDSHMNLVLGDAEEFRKVKVKGGMYPSTVAMSDDLHRYKKNTHKMK